MQSSLSHTISIKILPSKIMLGLIALVSIIACVILWLLPMLLVIKLTSIAIVVATSVYYSLRDALLVLPWSWRTLEVDTKGQFKIYNQRGECFQPTFAANSLVHTQLIVLNFRSAVFWRALPPVILFSHTQNADEIRRCRVWLRWRKHSQRAQEDSADALGA